MGSDAAGIVGHLAHPDRRRVVAALILGASTAEDVKAMTGLGTRAVVTALTRLVDSDLVLFDQKAHYWLVEEAFRQAVIDAQAAPRPDEHDGVSADAARVLRAFVRDGRLTSIPAQRSKRLVVLDLLAQNFEPGHRYPERKVNAMLRKWHDDTAALRRYLVDEGLLDREAGEYWRSGGSFDSGHEDAGATALSSKPLVNTPTQITNATTVGMTIQKKRNAGMLVIRMSALPLVRAKGRRVRP